jgi:hypothetical protein
MFLAGLLNNVGRNTIKYLEIKLAVPQLFLMLAIGYVKYGS